MSWDEDRGTARGVSDSKGNTHYLIFQSLQMSCGPASVAMVESQYKLQCMVDPEARARQLSQRYEGRWTATGGTGAGNLTRYFECGRCQNIRLHTSDSKQIMGLFLGLCRRPHADDLSYRLDERRSFCRLPENLS